MIKTILQDQCISFFIGAIFALAAKDHIKEATKIYIEKSFIRTLYFLLLVFIPGGIYLAYFWTDWSWLYFIPPLSIRPLITVIAIVGYLINGIIGFYVASYLIRKDKLKILYIIMILAVLEVNYFILFHPNRFFYVGTYDEFIKGNAEFIFKNLHLSIAGSLIIFYFIIPSVIIYLKNRKG